jgi:hypothetical protein
MEDNLSFSGNGRRLKFSENGIPLQFNISWYEIFLILNSKSKTICNSTNLSLASPELGTAQPQLVFSFIFASIFFW